MAGVPGGGLISGFAADVIDSVYSRDQEREADALGVDYMLANQYDPQGAIRLHELLVKSSSGFRIPFLSSHPSSDERIENLRALIEAKKPKTSRHRRFHPSMVTLPKNSVATFCHSERQRGISSQTRDLSLLSK